MSWSDWGPRRSPATVAELRQKAEKKIEQLRKKGQQLQPVTIEGRRITRTFWGTAWCDNLERYSDFSNRLPRGRRYVIHGALIDLVIEPGQIKAQVMGSSLYRIDIQIQALPKDDWELIKQQCKGRIQSLIELLRGELSESVMQIVTRPGEGLFPTPEEIHLDCDCPDWAEMCKHVAAALYGVGARLDERPELLFVLRGVDPKELVESAVEGALAGSLKSSGNRLGMVDLSAVFGVDIEDEEWEMPAVPPDLLPKKAKAGKKRKLPATRK